FNQLGKPLHVVGAGRYQEYLKSIAGPNIKFLGLVSDQELRDQYSGALGFIYPQVEDFGMMPLEAAACGTATIGQAKGGSLETIIPGQTGELLDQISAEKLSELINRWDQSKYQANVMRTHAEQFSRAQFEKKLNWVISKFLS
ncbi:MAG: glycosyltransferase, partial [Candidatus Doudnabacteria bacterium]